MANFQGALGGASSGAGLGMTVGGPIGAGIGGLIGGIGGLFSGNNKPELKEFEFSPDSLRSYSFADINLARENPDLYAELQRNAMLIKQAEQILAARSMGPTSQESRDMRDTIGGYTNRMAAQGLVGDPIAEAARADMEAKMRERLAAQAYEQRLQGLGQLATMQNQHADNMRMSLSDVMQNKNLGVQQSLNRDQLMNDRYLGQYQADMGGYQSKNKFYGDMFSGGLGMLGNAYNANALAKMKNPNAQMTGLFF